MVLSFFSRRNCGELLEIGATLSITVAGAFLAALGVVLHVRVTKADDLVLAVLVLDQDSELLGFARRLLRLVVAAEDFAGIADLLAHDLLRASSCPLACFGSGFGVLDLVANRLVTGNPSFLSSVALRSSLVIEAQAALAVATPSPALLSRLVSHGAPPPQTEGTLLKEHGVFISRTRAWSSAKSSSVIVNTA